MIPQVKVAATTVVRRFCGHFLTTTLTMTQPRLLPTRVVKVQCMLKLKAIFSQRPISTPAPFAMPISSVPPMVDC